MIAELSNPKFANKLKKANIFEKIIDNIIQLFVSTAEMIGLKKSNAYDKLRENVKKIIENYKDNFSQEYEKLGVRNVGLELFAGEKALVNESYAPHKARLQKAKELESSGADEIEIWEKTGWYKDKDSKWKFEISQSGGEFDWDLLKSIRYDYSRDNNYMKLKEVLQDKELFQAYPELQDLKIQADPLGEDILGEYKKDKKKISLEIDTLKSPQEAKSTLYHEIQHAIQDIEGFAYGEKQWENSIWDFNKYRNRHGEVEARNVQNRMQQVSGYETKKPPKEQIKKSIDTIDKNIQKAEQEIQEIKNGIGKYKGVSQKDKERSIKTNLEFIDSALRGRERAIKLRDNYTQTPHPYKTMDTPLKDTIAESTMQGEVLSKEPTNKVENMLESSNKILGETMTLKDRLLIDNKIKYSYLKEIAQDLPKPITKDDFLHLLKNKKYVNIQTPIKELEIEPLKAYEHLTQNSNKQNRIDISGAILPTLQNPLFITKDKKDTYYFYKPFKDEKGVLNIVSVAIPKSNRIRYKTSYIASRERMLKMINEYELVYEAF